MNADAGIGAYAGGNDCPACDETVWVTDRFCRYCGQRLRDLTDVPALLESASETLRLAQEVADEQQIPLCTDLRSEARYFDAEREHVEDVMEAGLA